MYFTGQLIYCNLISLFFPFTHSLELTIFGTFKYMCHWEVPFSSLKQLFSKLKVSNIYLFLCRIVCMVNLCEINKRERHFNPIENGKTTSQPMALILDGNSVIGEHARSNLCYLICQRHLIRSRAGNNRTFRKDLFLLRAIKLRKYSSIIDSPGISY